MIEDMGSVKRSERKGGKRREEDKEDQRRYAPPQTGHPDPP